MGRHERAVEEYRRYLAIDDRAPQILYKLAVSYYRGGQITPAIEPVRKSIALDERFAEAHYLLALCLKAQKRTPQAMASFARALELNPALGAAREELAALDLAQAKTREGIEQLEALAALEPSRPERLVSVGLAYARAGRTDAALATLARAAERYPQADVVYAALGRVWLASAEANEDGIALSKAIQALEAAAARANASSDTLTLYGRALILSGRMQSAERVLQQATTVWPVEPTAIFYLADAAERRGHVAAAHDALASYVALSDDEQKEQLAGRLATLSARTR
jgi:tetratricopeptide (TPR) repeat protein